MGQLYTSCLNKAIYRSDPNTNLQVSQNPDNDLSVSVLWDLVWLDYEEVWAEKIEIEKGKNHQDKLIFYHLEKGDSIKWECGNTE